MKNIEKYKNVFKETFSIKEDALGEGLVYESIPDWDSVGHMGLISELEEAFEIEFEADDIIDLSSFEIGKEIIKKYNIDLSA